MLINRNTSLHNIYGDHVSTTSYFIWMIYTSGGKGGREELGVSQSQGWGDFERVAWFPRCLSSGS